MHGMSSLTLYLSSIAPFIILNDFIITVVRILQIGITKRILTVKTSLRRITHVGLQNAKTIYNRPSTGPAVIGHNTILVHTASPK